MSDENNYGHEEDENGIRDESCGYENTILVTLKNYASFFLFYGAFIHFLLNQ